MHKQPNRTPTRRPTGEVPTFPRVNAEQRRALALLAGGGMNGVTETVVLAHGFTLPQLGILVRKGFVLVRWKPVRAVGRTIEVGHFQITDAGRRALET